MAFPLAKSTILFTFLLVSAIAITINTVNADEISSTEAPSMDDHLFRLKSEKVTHLRVYMHDLVSGPNITAIRVAADPATADQSIFSFGSLFVIDDPLTTGPNLTSELVGQSQGIYAFSSKGEPGLLMAINVLFTEGEYNGSSITILGRNAPFNEVREMPIVGGTGTFRLARGYVEVRSVSLDPETANAVLQYDLYVLHTDMALFSL